MLSQEKLIEKIAKVEIQGATNIALAVLDYMKKISISGGKKKLIRKISILENKVLTHRPTEPLVKNFCKLVIKVINNYKGENRDFPRYFRAKIEEIKDFYQTQENKIVKYGSKKINNENIFTHCHSSLVEKILIQARKKGKKIQVYNTETRPLFQGRITFR